MIKMSKTATRMVKSSLGIFKMVKSSLENQKLSRFRSLSGYFWPDFQIVPVEMDFPEIFA